MDENFIKMILGTALRHGATIAGGWLLKEGIVDNDGATQFIAAIMLLGGVAWSGWQKYGHAKLMAIISAKTDAVAGKMAPPKAVFALFAAAGLIASLLALAWPAASHAADVPAKAKSSFLTAGYPDKKCGFFYGLGTGGNAGAVNGAAVGTQIVQGDLDMLVGYTCPFAQDAFWFVEGAFGFANLNGSSNGLALSGPLVAYERFGVGSPIQALLGNLLPNLNFPAMPSTPSFPNGVTPTTGPASYFFAGLVEQDMGAQIGALSGHQWVIAPMIGIGMLTRYSNNMMVDTWAGWQMNSNSFCPGGGSACAKLGNMARVGVSLKY